MTLQQLKYMMAVVEKGSLSQAAKSMYVTQPMISKAIRELESEVGRTLLIRNSRGIGVSSDGIEFIGYARQVLQQMELLEAHYLNQDEKKPEFHVSSLHYSFAAEIFMSLVKDLSKETYEFSFKETTAYQVICDVREYRSEIGILYLSEENSAVISKYLSNGHMKFYPLFSTCPGVYVHKEHPLANRDFVTLEDLEEYPYVTMYQGESDSAYFGEELFANRQFHKKISITCGGTGLQMLKETDGYTLSPATFSKRIDDMSVVCVPLKVNMEIEIGYIIHKDRKMSGFGEVFLKSLLEKGKEIENEIKRIGYNF